MPSWEVNTEQWNITDYDSEWVGCDLVDEEFRRSRSSRVRLLVQGDWYKQRR